MAVDLFCGAGGSACGLTAAGFDVRMGLDHDAAALRVYRANHSHEARQMDLGDVGRVVETLRAVGPIDVLSASPPCTDFSSAGNREERNHVAGLTVACARVAVTLGVRCVLIENVPELLRSRAWAEARDLLVGSGYSMVVLRVNSAACGVAQVRRRVFVVATLGCDELALRRVEQEAAGFNRTPADAPSVRSCLADPAVATYWNNARSRHSSCVRSADLPSPTLRCNCLASPPPHYEPRLDDAGPLSEARVLTVDEMGQVASFPPGYFDSVQHRTVAGKFIGNCVPPLMAEQVARWVLDLLRAPVNAVERPVCLQRMRRIANRVSRRDRLMDLGLADRGATLADDGSLQYVGGSSARGDRVVERVLGWLPFEGWRVQVKPRRAVVEATQGPLDDLYVHEPGRQQPYRSIRQLLRAHPL